MLYRTRIAETRNGNFADIMLFRFKKSRAKNAGPEKTEKSGERQTFEFAGTPVISVHIPKCAGTSLKTMLSDRLADDVVFDYGDRVVDTTKAARQVRLNRKSEAIRNFSRLSAAKVIHGHFYATKYLDLFPDAKFITIIRRPEDLLLSYYHYLRDQDRKGHLISLAKSFSSLEDFIEHGMFQNIITKLTWPMRPADFAFIGFIEDFDAAVEQYSRLIGTTLPIVKKNIAKSEKTPIDAALMTRIRELNAGDYAFYDQARALFSAA